MKKKEKGQIESVDVVISLALLMIMLGYTYRVAEANYYAYKQDEIYSETRLFGASAAELLISSPETTCTVNTDTGETFNLMNCIQIEEINVSNEELRSKLGLVEDRFRVRVEIDGVGAYGDPFDDSAQNWYSENRVVITSISDMQKSELEKCMKGEIDCESKIATIYVWRVY